LPAAASTEVLGGFSSSSSSRASSSSSSSGATDGAIPLPDIREARMRKRVEEEMAKMEQEKDENRVKIKRSDKEAFRRVRATRRQCVSANTIAQ
jgi:hypothetical protein